MPEKPSYIDNVSESAAPRKSKRLPDYINGGGVYGPIEEELPAPTRMKSMAEQTKSVSPWEKEAQALNNPTADLPPEMPNAHLSEKEGEAQPAGFQPYTFFKQKINEFLDNKVIKKAAQLDRRIHFVQTDLPSVRIAEAKVAHLTPSILLGEEIERSQTKILVRFAKPSPETSLDILQKVLQVIFDWDNGIEQTPEKQPTFNTQRKSKDKKRTAPPADPLRYEQQIFVFGAFDRPGEVAVAIA